MVRGLAESSRDLERIFEGRSVLGLSEPELLARFCDDGDEAAFAALVTRHGPMVLAVCRGLLRDANDADDAFQATFLVLAKRAGSVRANPTAAPWLRAVAVRVARKARATAARRASRFEVEIKIHEVVDAARSVDDELRAVVAEELSRLPERYRAPLWACYGEGLTHEQAAERLAWPLGTVKGRLSRGREQLRRRLERRGVTGETAFGTLFGGLRVASGVPAR
ncbi:MAG: sigma-70 family RNA polymerase sigma factor, partial [Planctomycetota bacterium]|nr:sigma-70 family RNA polymerase sigma factor [Planctomycetota bacterium]